MKGAICLGGNKENTHEDMLLTDSVHLEVVTKDHH